MKKRIGITVRLLLFIVGYFQLWILNGQDIQNLTFNHLSINNGLSNPIVNDIIQDSDGFLWFCTGRGLNRYDGYEFKTFFHIPGDSTSLANSSVNCIDTDYNGNLWIGTGYGFSKYHRNSGSFESVSLTGSGKLNTIRALHVKSDTVVWLGSNEGLIKYNPSNGSFKLYQQDTADNRAISHNIVRAITEDKMGHLWIATFDGLNKFDPSTESFEHFRPTARQEADPVNNLIISLSKEEDDAVLWVGMQTGLAKFDMETGNFKVFRNELGYDGIGNNAIKSIAGPFNNQLWLGTDEGVTIFEIDKEKFNTYRHNPYLSNSLCNDVVIDISKDRSGMLWFGTNDGLSNFNLNKKQFNFHPVAQIDRFGEATGTEVKAIYRRNDDDIWLGGSSGLIKIDSQGQERWYTQQMDIGLESNIINSIYSDRRGNIWVCTTGGLNLYQPENDRFLHFDIQSDARVSKYVSSIIEYEPDKYLVGSSGTGLLKFEINSTQLLERKVANPQFSFVNDAQVNDIVDGKGGHVWIISGPAELYRYNIKEGSFDRNIKDITYLFADENYRKWVATGSGLYRLDDQFNLSGKIEGLEDIDIKGIEKDSDTGRLWIATTNSIVVLDTADTIDNRYMVGTDLPIKNFVLNSSFKDESGILYFGGIDGYISFDPEDIHEDDFINIPLITKITINNNEVSPEADLGGRKLTNQVVHQINQLNLKYNENSIEFSFSPFHFASPKSNQFAYRLENFDDDWRTTDGNYPKALYSNLNPGYYVFQVKAANPDGMWSNGTRNVEIHIDTPWWASPLAFASYILTMMIIGVLAVRQTMIRTKLKNELKFEQMQHERDEELHQLKMKFFTNISHEIRTPLTLILGPVDQMMQRITDKVVIGQLQMMKRNATRLLRLINQIMDMRKLEKGKLELSLENGDLVKMVDDVHAYFLHLAKMENISYTFKAEKKELLCRFDHDKIDKILFNLITNAFKFSGPNGKVAVQLIYPVFVKEKEFIEISVADSGDGIPPDQLEHIFERFYQAESTDNNIQKGTGIGLSMSSDYASLHGGNILVESTVGKGSIFRLQIPFLPTKVDENRELKKEEQFALDESLEKSDDSVGREEMASDQALPLILIVEDNHDMRHFVCDNLAGHYQILEAENGQEGFDLARKHNPQLIISDVMMPVMDGLELCNKIKTEFDTSHIPIILLTAKNSPESVLKGLKEGADDYITKPFFIKQLFARVENLINSRKILIDKFNRGALINPSDVAVAGIDEKFIAEIVGIVEKHMMEEELNVGLLARTMGMSHSSLYKKIKSITGLSGNEFIRNIRLRKAGQLLRNGHIHISEVVYRVGFNNRSYFSKCFHQMYGMTPSEFTSQEQHNS